MTALRVLLADDHPIVRDGLKMLLEMHPDITVIAEADNGHQALEMAAASCPDIAILDIGMPEMNGIDCAAAMSGVCPYTRVIMLSIHGTSEYIIRSIQAGARGYLLKDSLSKEIVRAIHRVMDGQYVVSKKISDTLSAMDVDLQRVSAVPDKSPLARLAPQERRVLQHVVEGLTSVEIASMLSLSPKTIETYRSRIMGKLGVENITELVKFAITHGVTSLDT
ncbi:MAG: DNA-binding response regulator [Anaerolineaceae bacterium]|nr:MAG: DNA-binding response regulator [Anaerolineaceae bacterium]